MKYQIIGSSAETGKFATLSVVAATDDEARAMAAQAGMIVDELMPLANPLLEARAKWISDARSEFLEQKSQWLANYRQHGAASAPSMSDIETTYFTRMSEISATVEQMQLAVPDVGASFPFAQFVTRRDQRVRNTHRAMDGLIALRTWSGWTKIRPPCGWRCRCYLIMRTRRDAIRAGWMTSDGKPQFAVSWPNEGARLNYERGIFPDKGFHGPKYVAP